MDVVRVTCEPPDETQGSASSTSRDPTPTRAVKDHDADPPRMSYATVPLVSCTWSARPSPTSHSTSTASPASSSARVGTSATRATRAAPPRA